MVDLPWKSVSIFAILKHLPWRRIKKPVTVSYAKRSDMARSGQVNGFACLVQLMQPE